MSDLIAASSLLLAILTTLYGVLYSSIVEILETKPKNHSIDNSGSFKKGISIKRSKLYPLLISSISLTLIFLPEAYFITTEFIHLIRNIEYNAISYSTIKTTYIAVTTFMVALTMSIVRLTFKFNKHLKKLNPDKL